MIATLLDTVTGKTQVITEINSFEWAENNWSCDCNRNYWNVDLGPEDTCPGHKRFLIIKAEFEKNEQKYSLHELNREYPKELLEEFLIPLDPETTFTTLDRPHTKILEDSPKTDAILRDGRLLGTYKKSEEADEFNKPVQPNETIYHIKGKTLTKVYAVNATKVPQKRPHLS